jgi:hypothetical protein
MSSTLTDEAPTLGLDKDEVVCIECHEIFPYSGRGSRANRKCPECKAKVAAKGARPTAATPAKLGKQVADMYAMLALGLMIVDPTCAQAVVASAESCGLAWEQAAKESPAIRRVLTRLVTASVSGQIVAAHLPIVLAVAQHHVSPSFARQAVDDGPVI